MENTKTSYQYLNDDGNWYPIEIKKCNMTRACGAINQGRPYQPFYIKDGKEHTIRYRKVTTECAIAELQAITEHGDGTCNGARYRLTPDGTGRASLDTTGQFRLFVYGTLKRGYWNHERFCGNAVSIENATVRGRLYELPSGIPLLVVPAEDILAVGTDDPMADLQTQRNVCSPDVQERSERWTDIQGEIITLADTVVSLPSIDCLEGFQPGYPSLYNRVLVTATTTSAISRAWCYATSTELPRGIRRLLTDKWQVSNQ